MAAYFCNRFVITSVAPKGPEGETTSYCSTNRGPRRSSKRASSWPTPSIDGGCFSLAVLARERRSLVLAADPEVHGVHLGTGGALVGTGSHAYAYLPEVPVEDVGLVAGAVHPPLVRAVRACGGARTPVDVLAVLPERVTGEGLTEALQASLDGLAIVGVVGEVALVEHLLGVRAGGVGERGVHA